MFNNQRPVNRLQLIDSLYERLELAKQTEDELVMLEAWELYWLLAPMKYGTDPDSTANLVIPDFEPGDDITQRHVPITVANAEAYVKRLDCGAETQECETVD